MIKIIGYSNASAGIQSWVADTAAEINEIPACETGSTVYIIENGEIRIRDGEGNWRAM